ncbi:EAL domain-containing protein [Salmonella enterica subsp. diarizonae]|nr:EAL domain-containing protein [Salmonella enterica subsp. diarizonae]EDI1748763.1 EAL domain-containing protein [Salmonella enterica]EDR6491470.1 EAL domain-containing protein [Salmonella enterica subsp. diarizonae]EDV2872605.1 EAL domain-containing protein [Salmonella enterica subsp. diarizonae]EEE2505912.1 EAL domain-containing protein [Salmonella enterica subsp. diarizonae]
MRYFFIAEPIRGMEGDLLGVEIITRFASSLSRPLHPEFAISSWDNTQKRYFLLDLLRTIAGKRRWFLRHGLFCTINIDRDMAKLVLQDKDIRALLHAMLFMGLQVAEHFSCQDNASVEPWINMLHKQPNPLWLGDLGAGNATAAPLVCGCFSGVKLDRSFFASQIEKTTFPLLVKHIRSYCDKIVVDGLEDSRYFPTLKTAGVWAIQGTLFPSVALEEVETLLLGSRVNTLRESI